MHSLICIERSKIPHCIWEPAAGNGATVRPLQAAGYSVIASDIADYGLVGCQAGIDYLSEQARPYVEGIITNPPFKLAMSFAEKALHEVPYLALLLRTNFLESTARLSFFRKHAPARICISSRRLPMMHRFGWQGPQAWLIPLSQVGPYLVPARSPRADFGRGSGLHRSHRGAFRSLSFSGVVHA